MRTKEGNKEKDILEAAVKVFAEYGYHKAKISKVAEVANVATGSVYVYFRNKEDILLKIFDNLWDQLFREFGNIADHIMMSPVQKLETMIDMVFNLFQANPSLAMVFVNEQNYLMMANQNEFTDKYLRFLDAGVRVLKEGIREKVFSPDIDPNIFKYFIFGAIRSLLLRWANDPRNFPIDKIRRNVKSLLKNGILA